MLIDNFRTEENGLVKPETIFSNPDENHNDHFHRHAECLKPYNPATVRKSISRGLAYKLSIGGIANKSKVSPAEQQQITADPASRTEQALSSRFDPVQSWRTDPAQSWGTDTAQSWRTDPPQHLTTDPTQSWRTDPAQSWRTDPAQSWRADPAQSWRTDPTQYSRTDPATYSRESAATNKLYGIPAGNDPMMDDYEDDSMVMLPTISADTISGNIGNGPKANAGGIGPKVNTGLGAGNAPVTDTKRQSSSVNKNTRPPQSWKAGKAASDLLPVDPSKSISKEVPAKTWKAVRFTSTISRGSNTTASILVTKSVQTVSTAYKLRLNRWPVWSSSVDDGYYHGRPIVAEDVGYHHPLWLRRILSFIFSQFGILLFLTSWISGHAALFQHLEQQPDVKLVNDVVSSRNELVITLATELRQVFPYEMAWRRKIDDYFIKFEATLNNATARGYSTNRRAFYKWDYLDFLLFSFQLVTGQGYGADVPKTEWSLLLSIPCVLIGLPFMWLFLIDLGAKWADTLSSSIQRFRWNLARRYPDVVSLQNDTDMLQLPPSMRHLHQNGLDRYNEVAPIIRTYQNGNGGRLLPNGDAPDPRFYSHTSQENSPTARSVWTVEPVAVAIVPDHSARTAKLLNVPTDGVYHHATPWVSTIFLVFYPFLGSLVFGYWGNLPFTTSFVLPLTSLILISPPVFFTSFVWRTLFHVYVLIGWVLLIATFLLWHRSWRDIIRNWAHDLSIKHFTKTYPLQMR